MKTMSLAKAPRTSALGHSSRYSEKRFGYANKTLCANQKRTFLLCLSRMQRASYLKGKQSSTVGEHWKRKAHPERGEAYQSLAGPRTTFLVWKPVLKRNLAAS